jgi:hypothetical protein
MRSEGDPIPDEFSDEFELEYHLSARALLRHTERIVPRKTLARVTGINVQQLSHYASGWRTPRPNMQQKIVNGIRQIGEQLTAIS